MLLQLQTRPRPQPPLEEILPLAATGLGPTVSTFQEITQYTNVGVSCGCINTAGLGSPELLSRSAALSQAALLPEDAQGSSVEEYLPSDIYDINGQQLDCNRT